MGRGDLRQTDSTVIHHISSCRSRYRQNCPDFTLHKWPLRVQQDTRNPLCRYYWKGMCEHIREFISRCDHCQRKKLLKIQKTRAQLKNVPVPKKIFRQIAIDLMQLSEAQRFTYVLGVQCFSTKWIEYIPIPDKKATTIAKQLYSVHQVWLS